MQSTNSVEDLDNAIQELDGMYQDLRRRSVQLEESLTIANFMDEDVDYDVPRPAQGIKNTVLLKEPSTPQLRPLAHNEGLKSRRFYSTSQLQSSNPPSSSGESDYSSGFGTLPNRNIANTNPYADYEYPRTPTFEASVPPFPVSSPDSDYHEDSSESESDNIYSYPQARRKSSTTSTSDYDEIPNHLSVNVNVINRPTSVRNDDPDYDEVYSVPTSRRETASETEIRIPDIVKIEEFENHTSCVFKNEAFQRQNSDQTPMTSQLETKANDVNDGKLFPVDENSNIEEQRHTCSEHTTSVVQEDKQASSNSVSISETTVMETNMDTEAQRRKPKDGPECPCRCRVAVPLMTAAIIISAAIVILLIAGYIYVGIITGDRLGDEVESHKLPISNTTESPTGSGDTVL